MAAPDRQELIRNAMTFLADPKIQSSPLAQRIQFLEAKGLTGPEIDEALRQSTRTQSYVPPQPYAGAPYPVYGPSPYAAQPPNQLWDWRDYFITGVISGAVTYGAVSLFRKLVLPHLRPPSTTAYEADRDALTAQFDAAEALLNELQAESKAVRFAVEEQKERIDLTVQEVESVVKEMREGESRSRDEMREVREEVQNIREMLPKMLDKNKENQTQSMAELQQELKSLKALLLSRNSSVTSGFSAPTIPSKPTIPAWQLASTPKPPSPAPPPLPATSFTPAPILNGKGKEVEVAEPNSS